jgi:hypothetical protein
MLPELSNPLTHKGFVKLDQIPAPFDLTGLAYNY